jgi:DNA-binding response OmpR family regulator
MSKKILIADDESSILKLLTLRLKANNYEVIAASDGMQAVMRAHQDKPDLIILDIRMPAGGGMTVCGHLKESIETMAIPIIFITAHPSDELRQKAREMGVEDFIAKPFNDEELIAKIRKILGEEVPEKKTQ